MGLEGRCLPGQSQPWGQCQSTSPPGQACPQCLVALFAGLGSCPWLSEGIPHVSTCLRWSLAVLTLACWGLGWDWRCDSSGVTFGITKCQCLVGFRLLGASKDKNNPHHKPTRSSGVADTPPSHSPHSPQVRSPAVCLEGLPFKDGRLGAGRETSDLQGRPWICPSLHSSVPGMGSDVTHPL